jgi:hypothetical protein
LLERGLEPLIISFAHFEIGITPKVFTLSLVSNLSIDKNRSTSCVGGLWEMDAPKGTCSELPSLKSGENTIPRDNFFWNLLEIGEKVKSF